MVGLLVAKSIAFVGVVLCCPFPFLGLQSLVKLAQAFRASKIFKVYDCIMGAMAGLDSRVNAVDKEIKVGPYLAGLE
jgi:hypothetical protein